MPNLSVLYKHIIQVENKNVGLKVCVWGGGGGHKHTIAPQLLTPVNCVYDCRNFRSTVKQYFSVINFVRTKRRTKRGKTKFEFLQALRQN